MLMNIKRKQNERGIGLLELMLSLSIIAILLVMATRYFMVANESQKINNALSEVNGIAGGAANYTISNSGGGYTGISIAKLIQGNFIPSSLGGPNGDGAHANPWNGDLQVTTATINNAPGYTVTVTSIPNTGTPSTCDKLASIINTSTKGSATCTGSSVTANFN